MGHHFTELCKPLHYDKAVIHEADIYQIKSRPIPQKLYDYLIQKGYKVSKPQTNQDFTYPAICHNDVLDFLKLKNYSVIV